MKKLPQSVIAAATLAGLFLAATPWLLAQTTVPEKKEKEDKDAVVLSPFVVSSGIDAGYSASSTLAGTRLGASVGGAKDAAYFRDAVKRGEFPHPDTITAEGLFSEHDLPLRPRHKSRDLFVLDAEAMPARILTKPDIRYLAQIGLSSGLDAATWEREPLNLVAVVDKSGSMSGDPLELVKRSLHKVLDQLKSDDQLSIVLYGDRAHVHLEPMRATGRNRDRIAAAIDEIESAGSTNMEAGLRVGFNLARRSAKVFHGRTRVMQFTDERPNTGDTSPESFMGLMRAASLEGIGQTTIGVGIEFDPELATTLSAVRGGNLFYFPDAETMAKTFDEELDTMVTELAYDLELKVKPAPGLRLAEVYGIPSEMVEWSDDRTMRFHVSTIFLSKRKGAIYLAFAPADGDSSETGLRTGAPVAQVSLAYRQNGDDEPHKTKLALTLLATREASVGLKRGRLLVSEFLGLRAAMQAQLFEHDSAKALQLLKKVETQFKEEADRSLAKETKLVAKLVRTMGSITGLEERRDDEEDEDEAMELSSCFLTE